MTTAAVTAALLAALSTSRVPPLDTLTAPQYLREFCAREVENGITVEVDKRGFRRYKRRGTPKASPPPADTEGIQQALNQVLAPTGFYIQTVTDRGAHIKIVVKEVTRRES